ncbi:hypothetical protein ACSVDA_01500 [Cytobacillus sp. Hm23]
MKKFHSFEDFERSLKNEQIPTMNEQEIHEAVFYKKDSKRTSFLVNRRLVLMTTVLLIILTTSVGVAAKLNGWSLLNTKGETMLEITNEEWDHPSLKQYDDKIDELKNTLEPGEFLYFLPIDQYERYGPSAVRTVKNDTYFSDYTNMKNFIENKVLLPTEFPGAYELDKGQIQYTVKSEENLLNVYEEMYKEGKSKGLEFVTKEGELSSNIVVISMTLKNELYEKVYINIISSTNGTKWHMSDKELEQSEKRNLNGVDYIYNSDENRILFAVEDGKGENWIYRMLQVNKRSPENPVLDLTENILKQK